MVFCFLQRKKKLINSDNIFRVFHWQFFIDYIFSISLNFGACCITSQWGKVQSKECYFMYTDTFWHFYCCFSSRHMCFYHFHFFFRWSFNFPQQSIDHSETWFKPDMVFRNCQWNYRFKTDILKNASRWQFLDIKSWTICVTLKSFQPSFLALLIFLSVCQIHCRLPRTIKNWWCLS